MKWRVETQAEKNARLSRWHLHFAWKPYYLGSGQYVWLEYVARRFCPEGNVRFWWVYGPKALVLTPDAPVPKEFCR
jgi:hypothetical protein